MNKTLPIIATRGLVVLPKTSLQVEIGREKSIKALQLAIKNKSNIIITTQLDPELDDPKFADISHVATLAKIVNVKEIEKDKEYSIEVEGIIAVAINNPKNDKEIPITCQYEELEESYDFEDEYLENLQTIIIESIEKSIPFDEKYFSVANKITTSESIEVEDYITVLNNLMMAFNHYNHLLLIESLSANTIKSKQEIFTDSILRKLPNKEAENQADSLVTKKINENLSKQQKEFYLRERLKAIKEELKLISSKDDEVEFIKSRLAKEPFPEHIKKKILHEINKYEQANPNETSIIKSYIDWLINIPWWQVKEDNVDLTLVSKILDKNHYGIPKVKERIIEYLATKIQNPEAKGPIICLVGPPGVGKTSLVKSIAEALNKVYVKVSLGGVKDESEIRGHRKTYLGAMPGRIIKGMKKAGVLNPLFLLDEIDKMSNDFRGDPSSALLEVLDPEQNMFFSDNYIEEEYDLSKVMFVATANYYSQIPEALIDRLEIIELSSYTPNEKLEIAKSHLINRVLKDLKLSEKEIIFTDEGINHIINYYAREAGVRELQRMIEKIGRKYLVQKLNKTLKPKDNKVINEETVEQYLGPKKYDVTLKDQNTIPGVVNGMAYTSAGGDLLPIETTYFNGKGDIVITGNLEQTMSESASVAFGYVKANAKRFGIDPNIFKNIDIHIHVPSGGIPKDGPSAGVTLTSSLISALTSTPVSTKISMTGEITLRGKVGIIGGVKEKVISAFRAGVREIFIPKEDERFLDDIPKEILSQIKMHLVEVYDDIFNVIFPNVKPFVEEKNTKKVESVSAS